MRLCCNWRAGLCKNSPYCTWVQTLYIANKQFSSYPVPYTLRMILVSGHDIPEHPETAQFDFKQKYETRCQLAKLQSCNSASKKSPSYHLFPNIVIITLLHITERNNLTIWTKQATRDGKIDKAQLLQVRTRAENTSVALPSRIVSGEKAVYIVWCADWRSTIIVSLVVWLNMQVFPLA